ncbi:hypothetical protein X915_gp045 [Bacillus phage vB_BanS-Tsamsa]|uniref:Uncharacterized protein n=1 Tax=Bacillus phage vB_BanS-Tsamsa TaxID=1308863 RepID=U5J9J5_9CAUD|nr:hypothetical protein X915_gp045 [Bacillus phage vB_BanS-Tsamsa]AGI11898.1 hypothetical protein [Bacillus phage vB_BanS-Tsamsa]
MGKFQEIQRKSGLVVTEIRKFYDMNNNRNYRGLKIYGAWDDTIALRFNDVNKEDFEGGLIKHLKSSNIAEIDWTYGEYGEIVIYIEG